MWSDGTPVTATDVMFWLNMLKAVGPTDWGAYTGFPDSFVTSHKVVSPTELQMTTNKAYSHTWFLYNDLSPDHPDAGGVGQDRVRPERTARPRSATAPRCTSTWTPSPRR